MATTLESIGRHIRSWLAARRRRSVPKKVHRFRPQLEALEDRTLPSAASALGTVFVIDMENHNLTQPPGQTGPQQLKDNPAAPYLNSLITPGNPNAAQTSWASNYQNAAPGIHPSEPNYIWQEGGSNFGVFNDPDPYANNGNPDPNLNNNVKLVAATGNNPPNLSALLQAKYGAAGWHAYLEDMQYDGLSVPTVSASGTNGAPNPYNGSTQYNYAVKHVGQLYYTATNGGTLNGPGPSDSTNPEAKFYSPLEKLTTDLATNNLAKYVEIVPNQFNDMHSSLNTNFSYNGVTYGAHTDQEAIALGDNFLAQIVPQIMASQAYKNNGTIVIWYDETEGGDTSAQTLAEIVISPLAKGDAYDSTLTYTHSSDLKSLQELFGVQAPGGGFLGDANRPGVNDLSDLFKPGALKTSTLQGKAFIDLHGEGSLEKGDPGVSGLTVTLTGTNSVNHQAVNLTTTTSQDGSYSFTNLLPGTYTIMITPPPGLKNDFTTPFGTIDNITLKADQTIGGLNFGFLVPGQHHHHHGHDDQDSGLAFSGRHHHHQQDDLD